LLLADQLPPLGGDTLFANQFLAYEALSPGLLATLGPMKAVHVYPGFGEGDPHTTAVHPVVRTHPVVGKRALFVNPAFVTRLEAMTGQESDPILSYLYHHQVRPEFCARVSWATNQLTLWDNRAVLHYAVNDYPGFRRRLQRVTVMERA
ncbi:MAG: TauD/TfdA dioxygenase family protein, partial [Acidimicrobiales bacterium]